MSIVLAFESAPGRPVLRGHAHFWTVIRELGRDGSTFTVSDVFGRTNGCVRSDVRDFVRRLERAGIVEHTGEHVPGKTKSSLPVYRLLQRPVETPEIGRDGRPAPRNLAQTNMWKELRDAKGGIDARSLSINSSTHQVTVPIATAKAFLKRLCAAGYLAEVEKGTPHRLGVWRLKHSMNTGPKPPMILRSKLVYDQNRQVVMGPVEAEEDRP